MCTFDAVTVDARNGNRCPHDAIILHDDAEASLDPKNLDFIRPPR